MRTIRKYFCFFILGFPYAIYAHDPYPAINEPWLTGSLLAQADVNNAPGDFTLNSGLYYIENNATPSLHSTTPTLAYTLGLTKRLDAGLTIPYVFNNAGNASYNSFQDIQLTLGIQAVESADNVALPKIRILLQETFPTGQFEHLNPALSGADATGTGSYQTAIGASIGQLYRLSHGKFLHAILNLIYTAPAAVNVSGFNAYGGDFATMGTVHPGNSFFTDLSFEYTLTQHVALAMDSTYTTTGSSTFNGNPGLVGVDAPNSETAALAPSLEYNFSPGVGVSAGAWFSVYTHNTNQFVAGVVSFNYSYNHIKES